MKNIQNIITYLIISLMLLFSACKPIHQVIVDHVTETHYVDSIIKKDSICYIPVERYVYIVNKLDTLKLQTSLAEASAYLDTTMNLLKGEIHNKKGAQFQYIKETETIYKDSLVEKPVPYPEYITVEKPLNKKLLTWSIFASLGLLGSLCFIFRKWIIKLFKLFA